MDKIITFRNRVLEVLEGKLAGFFLAGGTALSLYYFHHRESYDLDFFTKEFSRKKIEKIISEISRAISIKIDLRSEQNIKDKVQWLTYSALIDEANSLKIDFVEDVFRMIEKHNIVNGIPILSKEDIYLRKIFAACGCLEREDETGKKKFLEGRQDIKDFFDLYFLSTTFMPVSRFVAKYCSPVERESIIVWFGTYDRISMKLALNDIRTDKKIAYNEMEKHFKLEIENMIKQDIE